MTEIGRLGTVSLIRQGKHRFYSLTIPSDVLDIKAIIHDTNLSTPQIASLYGVQRNTIWRIKTGRTWANILIGGKDG